MCVLMLLTSQKGGELKATVTKAIYNMRAAHRIFLATSIAISVLLREAQALRKKPAGCWVFFNAELEMALQVK